MNPDGGDERQLTFFGPDNATCCAVWSPDGQQLVFEVALAPNFITQLWVMNSDGSNQHQLFLDNDYLDLFPSFSPDGSNVLFSRCQFQEIFQCAIHRVSIDGTGLTAITPFNSNIDIIDWQAAYSPNGKTIAFTSLGRGGLISAVYLMDADGSHIRPLTPPGLLANMPDWSPDGRRIVFSTNGQEGIMDEEIWVINVDGGRLLQLTNHPGVHDSPGARRDFAPSWSPQGDAIAFEGDSADLSQFGIYVLKLNGSQERLSRRGGSRSSVNRMNAMRAAIRRRPGKLPQKLVERDGFFPRWGSAQ